MESSLKTVLNHHNRRHSQLLRRPQLGETGGGNLVRTLARIKLEAMVMEAEAIQRHCPDQGRERLKRGFETDLQRPYFRKQEAASDPCNLQRHSTLPTLILLLRQ